MMLYVPDIIRIIMIVYIIGMAIIIGFLTAVIIDHIKIKRNRRHYYKYK